jgi:SAM-dependent methyltransferase
MNKQALVDFWRREEKQPFTGWDFSYLEGRMLEEQVPWSYTTRSAELMQQSCTLLDMGTGGGERLLTLQKFWPEKVVVTEDYPPNFELAKQRLGPLGVKVLAVPLARDGLMPFADVEFDLVLNRHSGLNCAEVARVLKPQGVFLTQQVHGLWAEDLIAAFDARPQWPDATPAYYVPRLEKAGLVIENLREWQGRLGFTDVGAVVYYLKAVPWLVPGFSVETHVDALFRLESQMEKNGQLTFTARKYLIEARKVIESGTPHDNGDVG